MEIVSILDFYKTFAEVAGAANRIPTDRAMDSIAQNNFFFGDQERSNREFNMFFHAGELLATKWRNFKVHFSMRDVPRGPVVAAGQAVYNGVKSAPNMPWMFDLENDPKELWNIGPTTAWVSGAIGKILAEYEASVVRFPNLEPTSEKPSAPPAMQCSRTGLPPSCGYNVPS